MDWFFERLRSFGTDAALVYPTAPGEERTATYAGLVAQAETWESTLRAQGVCAGQVVGIEGAFTEAATSLLLALWRLGAIVAPLVREMRPHRDAFLDIAQGTLLIEVSDVGEVSFTRRELAPDENPLLAKLRERKQPGLLIFSSGSSGKPKAILHDVSRILEKFREAKRRKTTLCFLLFDHIGGIDTLLNTLSSGGKLVTVERREPECVARAIAKHQVHTLPTSPTFLNLFLIAGVAEHHNLSSLKVIAYGTEPMPEGTLQRLHEAFPDVSLVQTYGMSELGVLRSRSKSSNSPWIQFSEEGYRVQVREGVLWVKADGAMLGYLNAPDLFDEEGWLNTQDAVEVDGTYLRILGRKSELINVGGQKVYPNEVESHLLEMPNVIDVAVFGKANPMTGQMVAARFTLSEPEDLSTLKKRMHAFCRERLAPFQVPRLVEIADGDQFGVRFKKLRRNQDG